MATFHPLTVARVDQLCDDASAITLSVPDELAELYRFRPGQSLTVRRMVGDREERRSYSICAPAGFPPRIGVREVSDGAVSGWLVHESSGATFWTCSRRLVHSRRTWLRAAATP